MYKWKPIKEKINERQQIIKRRMLIEKGIRKMQNKIIENDKQEKSQELGKRSSASCKQVASIFVII